MNRIAKVLSQISDDMLMHYGVARRSGRYPWGSGDNPYQHSGDFLSRVQSLKKSGMSETDIAKTMGLTTTQLRTQMSLAKDERRAVQVATAKDLREKGYSLNEIADKMGFANDSSVRSLLNENSEARMNQAKATADVTKCALTTIDNPYDPFDQFTEWMLYDEEKGYHSTSYLGRIARTSDELSDEENDKEIERAIDEIIKYDFRNIYKKVKKHLLKLLRLLKVRNLKRQLQ